MSVNILIVTQTKIGKSLLKGAEVTYRKLPIKAKAFCVGCEGDPENLLPKLEKQVEELDDGDGVLILTDLFGSTASNIAHRLKESFPSHVKIVAGLNFPMLIKAINYADEPLKLVANKAVAGGREGVHIEE
ncbi:MAG: PTS fructose transporter subunit IIA [Legionellaceae bacterium]|nr:PTS fructose transporter subunit IIA [Legionellaceae bacterium]